MIILGIDPSLASTGICLMNGETGEVGETMAIQPSDVGMKRLAIFRQEIINLITMMSGIRVFIEGYSFGSGGKRESMAELGGVIRLTLYDHEIEFIEVPPKTLKKFATGNGNADKIQMGVQLMKEFSLEYPTSDQTDAFWLCQFGIAYHELTLNLSKARQEVIADMKKPKVKVKKKK
jgi:crossover junction endodeoxyribonuclease RuvC